MAVIAITREMGTGGREIASQVAERLGLDSVHSELVEHDIAEFSGMAESEVHRALEGEATLFERWRMNKTRLSRSTTQEVFELAAKGNVLIRGWRATYLLRAIPHAVCVRLCAPMDFRIKRTVQQSAADNEFAAQRKIQHSDTALSRAMQRLFDVDYTDAMHYSAIFNSARVPISDCVQHIVTLAESDAFRETNESRQKLNDALIRARVLSALERHLPRDGIGINVDVNRGHVELWGMSNARSAAGDATRIAEAVDGVILVENRMTASVMEGRGVG